MIETMSEEVTVREPASSDSTVLITSEMDVIERGGTMSTEEYVAVFETSELHEVNGNNIVE